MTNGRLVRKSQTSGEVFGPKLSRALSFMDANQMLPAPVKSTAPYQFSHRKDGGKVKTLTLIGRIKEGEMMLTPTKQDGKNATLPPSQAGRDTIVGRAVDGGMNGQLNPRFYEWMMGFPTDWTHLPETNV